MSQLGGNTGQVGRNVAPNGTILTWDDLVNEIIRLTILAFHAMDQDRVVKVDWEENTFTSRLGEDYLRGIAFDNDASIRVTIRSKKHTKKMKDGTQATIEAKEMDMILFGVWERNYHQKHFVWEAKRVADAPEHRKLDSEYVNEAIYRFIDNAYAENLADAGILGYVLVGDPPDIVQRINASMGRITKRTALAVSDNLTLGSPVCGHPHIYRSQHRRIDTTQIRLHHLFLPFTF